MQFHSTYSAKSRTALLFMRLSKAAHVSRFCSNNNKPFLIGHESVCTWVIERYQYVGGGLLLGSSLAVNDVKGNSLCFSYVIRHAACGVNDKTQDIGLREAHQSAGTWERHNIITSSCSNLSVRDKVSEQ